MQLANDSFCSKIERGQYHSALAITGAVRGTSQTKIQKTRAPVNENKTMMQSYLNNMLPNVTHNYQTGNSQDLATYQTRTNIFKYSSSYLIME